jgi:hypothetical protein
MHKCTNEWPVHSCILAFLHSALFPRCASIPQKDCLRRNSIA